MQKFRLFSLLFSIAILVSTSMSSAQTNSLDDIMQDDPVLRFHKMLQEKTPGSVSSDTDSGFRQRMDFGIRRQWTGSSPSFNPLEFQEEPQAIPKVEITHAWYVGDSKVLQYIAMSAYGPEAFPEDMLPLPWQEY